MESPETLFPSLLKQLEYLKILPRDICYLVILHSHADHIMTFAPLQETFPWMQIVAPDKTNRTLNDERLVGKFKESDFGIAESIFKAGQGDEVVHQSPKHRFPVDLFLEEGDQIDLGKGVELKVLETPRALSRCR